MGEAAREPAIGYYAHHQGAGHVTRALAIARHLPGSMTLFGSNLPDERPHANVDYCPLPVDVDEHTVVESFTALHYAPLAVAGLRERMGALVDWFRAAWPCVLVVDVSVEVALLARLCGVPTIYVRQRGQRFDAAHSLAYACATRLLAPYPISLEEPGVPASWMAKTDYAGTISRYEQTVVQAHGERSGVTVICGHGGTDFTVERLADVARACPDWEWTVAGPISSDSGIALPPNLHLLGAVSDPLPWLVSAQVVVGSAGDSLVSELAELRCRFICVPETRPFDEQQSTGRLLEAAGLALHCPVWPDAKRWPSLLEQAMQLSPDTWRDVADGNGAARAACAISQTARQVLS